MPKKSIQNIVGDAVNEAFIACIMFRMLYTTICTLSDGKQLEVRNSLEGLVGNWAKFSAEIAQEEKGFQVINPITKNDIDRWMALRLPSGIRAAESNIQKRKIFLSVFGEGIILETDDMLKGQENVLEEGRALIKANYQPYVVHDPI